MIVVVKKRPAMKNKIEVDHTNCRIVAYLPERDETVIDQLNTLQKQANTTKTICYIKITEVPFFTVRGFIVEGMVSGFFCGEVAAVVSQFFSIDRQLSQQVDEQIRVAAIVKADNQRISEVLIKNDYTIEHFQKEDIEGLATLYKRVFEKYPTNVFDKSYLLNCMSESYFFVVAKYKGEIVSAASALINDYQSAEITDCATDPAHRGNQLLHGIIIEIEKLLRTKQIYHAYSLTRALSIGMNVTIKRFGYEFEGKLVNNCIISTGFEDMNIWSKTL